jgi:hypothetical protein
MNAQNAPRDVGNWAVNVERLTVPAESSRYGYNIEGKRVSGPQQGFGRMWQRTYAADLGNAATPEAVIADWRANFGSYWPRAARFYGSSPVIQPGDVAPLSSAGFTSGILVVYADDTSFTFLTPEGHMFAAMITFSSERSEGHRADGQGAQSTLARIRILLRCSDPIFEAMWPLLRPGESYMWTHTLRSVAAAHGVVDPTLSEQTECVDRRRQWKNWRNVRDNAVIRTGWHAVSSPFRSNRTGKD